MKKIHFYYIIVILLIITFLSGCVSSEIRKISGIWENDKIGVVEFRDNKTFIFALAFETKVGNYLINEKEIIIKADKKNESDYKYFYRLEGDILVLSQREDMKALFGSENLIFKKSK